MLQTSQGLREEARAFQEEVGKIGCPVKLPSPCHALLPRNRRLAPQPPESGEAGALLRGVWQGDGRRPWCEQGMTLLAASIVALAAISRSTTSKWPYNDAAQRGFQPLCGATRAVGACGGVHVSLSSNGGKLAF